MKIITTLWIIITLSFAKKKKGNIFKVVEIILVTRVLFEKEKKRNKINLKLIIIFVVIMNELKTRKILE